MQTLNAQAYRGSDPSRQLPTSLSEIIRDHKRLAKLDTVARQLAISMGILGDVSVNTRVLEAALEAPAQTTKDDPLDTALGGWVTGFRGWGKLSKILNSRRYTVTYDCALLPDRDLGVWIGTSWHELGHMLYSPMDGSVEIDQALNLLEDARIETLLISKWPKMKAPIQAALAWMIGGQKTRPGVGVHPGQVGSITDPIWGYAWMCGRPHLPAKQRNAMREACAKRAGTRIADELDDIFRTYLSMSNKFDPTLAQTLKERLNEILDSNSTSAIPPRGRICSAIFVSEGQDNVTDGPPTIEVSDALDELESNTNTQEDYKPDDLPRLGPPTPKTKEEAHEQKIEAAKVTNEVLEALAQELESMAGSDEDLNKEVATLERMLANGSSSRGKSGSNRVTAPTPKAKQLAQQIRKEAAKFNDETGKGLIRRRDYGRLRPMRYEATDDLDISYDQWEPGLDQEMFVMVLMDVSGSMSNKPITEVLYGLEVGLSDVATVEPVLWDDQWELPAAENTWNRMVHIEPRGGTDPTGALSYAHTKLIESNAANKLLVIYTDGQWTGPSYQLAVTYVEDLMNRGVSIRIIGEDSYGRGSRVGSLRTYFRKMREEDVIAMNSLEELPEVVQLWTRNVLVGKH